MQIEDLSYAPHFKVGALVMHDAVGLCRVEASRYVGKYPHNRWDMVYDLWHRGELITSVPEPILRAPTYGDLLLYRDPKTKALRMVYLSAWPILFALNLSLAGIILLVWWAIAGEFTLWHGVALGSCLGVWALTGIGTWRNYNGKQF